MCDHDAPRRGCPHCEEFMNPSPDEGADEIRRLHSELAIARERLGPAGYEILVEIKRLRSILGTMPSKEEILDYVSLTREAIDGQHMWYDGPVERWLKSLANQTKVDK